MADGGNGHYYALTSGATTWTDAEAQATALGGHLVAVNSQAEQDFLDRTFMSGPSRSSIFWNGFNDLAQEGTFVWTTGEPVTYTNWHPGEPNNYPDTAPHQEDYAAMNWCTDVSTATWRIAATGRYHQ